MTGVNSQAPQMSIPELVVENLPNPVLTLGADDRVIYANSAAEEFFQQGRRTLTRWHIHDLMPPASPALAALTAARSTAGPVNEYGIYFGMPRPGQERPVDLHVTPIGGDGDLLMVSIVERTMPDALVQQSRSGGAARSVAVMASFLAHEIRNPLAGIRGAAQLLETQLGEDNRPLAELIRDEVDRIGGLVGQMECFTDARPPSTSPVNIHAVLGRVKQLIFAQYGGRIRIREHYDPSLPDTPGNADQLVQVFLNIVKNAAEAIESRQGPGEIFLRTAFSSGIRLSLGGGAKRRPLPLVIEVADNGPGIADEARAGLFNAFFTTKATGRGLGLALAAKIVSDHGGTIDCPETDTGALFRVMLPAWATADAEDEARR